MDRNKNVTLKSTLASIFKCHKRVDVESVDVERGKNKRGERETNTFTSGQMDGEVHLTCYLLYWVVESEFESKSGASFYIWQ